MEYDIVFIGNTSTDYFNEHEQLGGGAFYSATSASIADSKMKIAFYSKINRYTNLRSFEKLFIGEKVEDNNTFFDYSSSQNECNIRNLLPFSMESINLKTKHLHISVRKGLKDICLDGIKYNSLSVDITKNSINTAIKKLQKIKNIDLLFCNYNEYLSISSLKNIKCFVVTNADKSIAIYKNSNNCYYYVPFLKKYKKEVGAGDSFIGGFLSEWVKNNKMQKSVLSGIVCAHLSMIKNNQFNISSFDYRVLRLKYKKYIKELPKKIIVIGSAGAGKTKFAKSFVNYNPEYRIIDDYDLLMDIVNHDDLHMYTNKLAVGFEITNYNIWNDVIDSQYTESLNYKNVVYELSRGTDWSYIKNEGISVNEIYDYAIKTLSQNEKDLVINLFAPYSVRKKRNRIRSLYGDHCVDDKTMSEIYKKTFTFSRKNIKRIKNENKNIIEIVNVGNRKYKNDVQLYHYVLEKTLL